DVFQVKFGKIDQAVDLFSNPEKNVPFKTIPYSHNVMTDISGKMYTLVSELAVPGLEEYRAGRDAVFETKEFQDWFRQFQLFVEGGRREYYTFESDYTPWSRPGMIVVRETYQAYKWQIRSAVELLRRYGGLLTFYGVGQKPRILTDASGPMFQAIIEVEVENLSVWEMKRREVFKQVEFQVWFNQMLTTAEAGTHDFYRVEYTAEERR
ncbi:MAG TPA: hypothetical protein PLV53_05900, partial [Anaerolineaceae bacterium]|nr:hypothetical protein [Anaerolineaceae bacterium]